MSQKASPANTLIGTAVPQHHETVHFCCFKSSCWWNSFRQPEDINTGNCLSPESELTTRELWPLLTFPPEIPPHASCLRATSSPPLEHGSNATTQTCSPDPPTTSRGVTDNVIGGCCSPRVLFLIWCHSKGHKSSLFDLVSLLLGGLTVGRPGRQCHMEGFQVKGWSAGGQVLHQLGTPERTALLEEAIKRARLQVDPGA